MFFIKLLDAIFGTTPHSYETAEIILDRKAEDHHPKLDYRNSIVDLLELIDLPSDLKSRERLAKDLHYPGQLDGSAAMNEYLHQCVMARLGIVSK